MFTFFLVNKDQHIISKSPTPFHVSLETVQPGEDLGAAEDCKTPGTELCAEISPSTHPQAHSILEGTGRDTHTAVIMSASFTFCKRLVDNAGDPSLWVSMVSEFWL